ncbi:MAG: hypothetical protein P1P83_11880 [Bacteroidales bacterium]|nr:hypothetical protein [Bacteroidales bacterium]MDT8374606.1 hypothetical protein [Bacteroidales bacterium]
MESGFIKGRVTQEHRERYVVTDGEQEYDAEITGNLRYSAASREDFPAVGDWVAMTVYEGGAGLHQQNPSQEISSCQEGCGQTG